uniref:Uncharacterized protein n=1 Tax=Arion vulgaris TaxID=1028688 RepID=A0A0B6ZH33_9EUPU
MASPFLRACFQLDLFITSSSQFGVPMFIYDDEDELRKIRASWAELKKMVWKRVQWKVIAADPCSKRML